MGPTPDERERDARGRPQNARPRDGLGRPLPRGAAGVPRVPDDIALPPPEALAEAQRLLDAGMPFHAHEVLEGTWKAAPEPERALWKGLAQLAVGLTHALRGNRPGAVSLLRRGRDAVAGYAPDPPHGVDVAGLVRWADTLADSLATPDAAATEPPVPPVPRCAGELGRPGKHRRGDAVAAGVKVEIWSDVVCPWCYVGKRRFETALSRFEHAADVEVEWKSFELDPQAPPSAERPGGQAAHLAAKYGRTLEQAQQMLDQTTATAAGEGLDYRFDLMRAGNSFDAHRLLHLAKDRGGLQLQDTFKERLDRGTFTEGLAVSDHDELTKIAVDVGLDEAEVRDVLASDRYAAEVRADQVQGRAYGINGVPFFVLDGRYGVSGAQPAEHLLAALEQAWSTRSPLTLVQPTATGEGGEACEGDACAI